MSIPHYALIDRDDKSIQSRVDAVRTIATRAKDKAISNPSEDFPIGTNASDLASRSAVCEFMAEVY